MAAARVLISSRDIQREDGCNTDVKHLKEVNNQIKSAAKGCKKYIHTNG